MQPMLARFPALDSLRRKTVFGYGAVALLVVGLSAFSLIEMRLLETQIAAGERISQFFGLALEIRRFEKNYILYHQEADLAENRAYVEQAKQMLTTQAKQFASFDSPAHVAALRQTLDDYAELMTHYAAGRHGVEVRIRLAGKEIVTVAENWSRQERTILQAQLERHRHWLLGSIIVIVLIVILIGQLLAWRVARPLKQLEESMAAVAAGRISKLELPAGDREIASLTAAFNHMLQELDLRQGQLLRSEKLAALGTLLSGVAHELNNPLSNISTSCEILAEEIGARGSAAVEPPNDGTAFELELLQQIDQETWRARRIVRSLLDYARDREFRREPISLPALVEDSLRLIRGQIPAQVEVRVDIPPQLQISGDKQRLQQALFNLIGNAIDALDGAGELSLTARAIRGPWPADALVFGQCRTDRPSIEIELRDNGHGIPAAILPRIFDPFFTTKDVGRGLGLGLFIVFEIVEEHGGCIAVSSAVGAGSGTTFLIRLPVQDSAS
jgi:two-component system NtrC family sensor kinase